jgi:Fic family protein
MQKARASALVLRLIDELFAYPAINAQRARSLLKVSSPSVHLNIQKLVKAGILRECTGKKRNRIYLAPEIVSVIESDNP